ncbi:MAG: PAS domain-containing protein [Cytophagaceae bacterium]
MDKSFGTFIKETSITQYLLPEILKNIFEPVVIFSESGLILYGNPSFEKFSGYSISELNGKNIIQLLQPPGMSVPEKVIRAMHPYSFNSSEFFRISNGNFNGQIVPFQNNGYKAAYIILKENNQSLKTHQATKQPLSFSDTVEALANIGRWEVDVDTGKAYWSAEMFRIFELPEKEHLPHGAFLEYVHPEDVELVVEVIDKVHTEKSVQDFEYRILVNNKKKCKTLAGRVKPVLNEKCDVVKLIGYCQDITDRKITEDFLSGIIKASIDGIVVLRAKRNAEKIISDFELIFLNDIAEQHLGLSFESFKGKDILKEFPWLKDKKIDQDIEKTIDQGISVSREVNIQIADRPVWIKYKTGKYDDCCVITFQDFTYLISVLEDFKKNQVYLNIAYEAAHIGSFAWDFERDKLRSTGMFCSLLNLPAGEFSLEKFLDVVHVVDRSMVQKCIYESLDIGECSIEFQMQNTYKYFWLKGGVFEDELSGNKIFLGSIIDITKRRQSEDALIQLNEKLNQQSEELIKLNNTLEQKVIERTKELSVSEERFLLVSKATEDAVWDWDFNENKIWFNQIFMDKFGYHPFDFTNGYEYWKSRLHPEDKKRTVDSLERAIAQKSDGWKEVYRFLNRMGNYVMLVDRGFIIRDSSGRPTRMVGVMTEVTDLYHIEERLRESESNYRFLAESMPQLVWIADQEGKFVYVNKQWIEYTGMEYDYNDSSFFLNVLHEDDKKLVEYKWSKSIESGRDFHMELRMKDGYGKFRWFLSRAVPMRDENGVIIKWLGTCTDIHDQKKLLDDLVETKLKLDEINRNLNLKNEQLSRINKELDTFAYAASHDLKSPVKNIESLLGFLRNDIPAELRSEVLDNYFNMLFESVINLKKTIQELSEVTRIEENGEAETCKFSEIVADVSVSLMELIEQNQATVSASFDVSEMKIPRRNLRSILYNIISNSIKYRSKERVPKINIKTERLGEDSICLSIKDNGRGIKQEDIPKIFLPFKRIDYDVEGSGMGMVVVKRIVDQNGGNIEVKSTVGEGTEFLVRLKG